MNKKMTGLKIVNIVTLLLGIVLYAIITFFVKTTVGSGYKELENIILIAIPCLLIFVYSLMIDSKISKRNCLIFYLTCYIVVLIGFTFTNNRSNILIEQSIMFREYNLIPFYSIIDLLQSQLGFKFALYNLIGNFLMLTPLAIFLPMIDNKFKNVKVFVITIITSCLFIEIIQYITSLGSLDIDDFILNVSGVLILYLIIKNTKVNVYIKKIFLEYTIPKKICIAIYMLLLIIFFIFLIRRISLVYNHYQDQKIDMSNVACETNIKVYLGDVENYSYYSKCNYGDSYITVGKQKYRINEFIKSQKFNDTMIKKLNLEKIEIVTKAILEGKETNQKVKLHQTNYSNIYLYGYNSLIIEKGGKLYDIKNELNNKTMEVSIIHSLTKLNFLDNKNGYSIETGEYFNILTCGDKYSSYNDFYILEPQFKITKDTCGILDNIPF